MEEHKWFCQNGHLLGFVRRSSAGIRQLHLLEYPEERQGEIAVIEGSAQILCLKCKQIRRWVPGEETLIKVIEKLKKI